MAAHSESRKINSFTKHRILAHISGTLFQESIENVPKFCRYPTRVNALFSDIMGEKPLEKKAIFFQQKHKIQVEFSPKKYERNTDLKKNTQKMAVCK